MVLLVVVSVVVLASAQTTAPSVTVTAINQDTSENVTQWRSGMGMMFQCSTGIIEIKADEGDFYPVSKVIELRGNVRMPNLPDRFVEMVQNHIDGTLRPQ